MPVHVLKTDEGATLALAGILERPTLELHVGVVVEQDVHRLDLRALELLSREHGAMTPREVVEVGADDETDVLEAHPIDALMKRRNQLDELDRRRRGERQRVCEQEFGDRPSVPDVFEVGDGPFFELVTENEVLTPGPSPDGEMADRKRAGIDSKLGTALYLPTVERASIFASALMPARRDPTGARERDCRSPMSVHDRATKLERLWSRAGAARGNRWQD